jgi:hypothetical protein
MQQKRDSQKLERGLPTADVESFIVFTYLGFALI